MKEKHTLGLIVCGFTDEFILLFLILENNIND
jgi:hypothetical protein